MPLRRRKSCADRWHSRPRSSATAAFRSVAVEAVVPGDILRIKAGDIIPADALLLESTAFTAGEAALTGEPYPVEKRPGVVTTLAAGEASNALFRGSVAQTGEATALVVSTGRATMFGAAASALAEDAAPSPFQRDLHAFGLLTARMTLGLVLVVLTTHMLFGRPVLESLMFAVALAVGLTPELLPMITTVTLSRGALRMASRKVIVKRLASIHDLGAMTVLCTDKTGTLTSAEITLARSLNSLRHRRPARRPARRDRGRSGWRPRRIGRCAGGRNRRCRAGLDPRRPACLRLQSQARIGAGVWPRRPIADRQGRARSDVGALYVAP